VLSIHLHLLDPCAAQGRFELKRQVGAQDADRVRARGPWDCSRKARLGQGGGERARGGTIPVRHGRKLLLHSLPNHGRIVDGVTAGPYQDGY
jgi:hypothetical protein